MVKAVSRGAVFGPAEVLLTKLSCPLGEHREQSLGAGTGIRHDAELSIPCYDVPASRRALRRHRSTDELERSAHNRIRGLGCAASWEASGLGNQQNLTGRKR